MVKALSQITLQSVTQRLKSLLQGRLSGRESFYLKTSAMVKVFGRRLAEIVRQGVGRRTETAHARTCVMCKPSMEI